MSIDPRDLTPDEYARVRAQAIREMRQREEIARQEGIKSIIMDFRTLLAKLKVCSIPNSAIDSYKFMQAHSPLYKNKVK